MNLPTQISSDPYLQDFVLQEDPIFSGHQGSNLTSFMEEGDQPHNTTLPTSNNGDQNLANEDKKAIRKEIERQRRQQMSTLHASLRSLLPLASLKGKRSASDQIQAAAEYIKHLRSNIQQLSYKRDKLKMLEAPAGSSSSSAERGHIETTGNDPMNRVTVQHNLDGAEIVVQVGSEAEGFRLSSVLEAIFEEGLDVISCFSTRKAGRMYNTIHCQTCTDLSGLEQKLDHLI
ncbi:hypothetical protein K2173_026648 [Erythroxylum novogranatense]|uniref:BHLH domain-containing protein n=1 Tax=Erythroxylum novogranatense TaxID=1862640 RepID=A0AAV8TWV1_9ROSI|nr:hypothetical protein K2173_026648 [Erythroxylum novogranatense]